MSSTFSVYVVGLCFGIDEVAGMLDAADQFCVRNFPGRKVVRVVVDNIVQDSSVLETDFGVCIAGDNSFCEFSGWQKGLDFIRDRYTPSASDVCLLANDTVHRRNYAVGGDRFLDDFRIKRMQSEWPSHWVAGYFDDFPAPAKINGLEFSSWIRSNFVAFNWACLDLISPLVFPCRENELFVDDITKGFWNPDAPLSENWKAYISSWMFGTEDPLFPEYRLKWIKSQPLSANNHNDFRRKAICILSEHYLSARLLSKNIAIFDFNIYPKLAGRHLTPYYG